jgi:G:T/U-mismatch repair DNA glycosylase
MPREETHPYNTSEIIPEGTCLLIIGTAPPPRFSEPKNLEQGDVDFFYGSKSNQLWSDIFRSLYGDQFFLPSPDKSREFRRQFLINHRIWVVDVLQTYRRKDGKEKSASDSDLVPVTYTKFGPIFRRHSTIDTVVITGAKAETWTGRQMSKEGLILTEKFSQDTQGQPIPRHWRLKISLDGAQREIDAHTLPSPSAGNWMSYTDDEKLQMYKDVLLKRCPSG